MQAETFSKIAQYRHLLLGRRDNSTCLFQEHFLSVLNVPLGQPSPFPLISSCESDSRNTPSLDHLQTESEVATCV